MFRLTQKSLFPLKKAVVSQRFFFWQFETHPRETVRFYVSLRPPPMLSATLVPASFLMESWLLPLPPSTPSVSATFNDHNESERTVRDSHR